MHTHEAICCQSQNSKGKIRYFYYCPKCGRAYPSAATEEEAKEIYKKKVLDTMG